MVNILNIFVLLFLISFYSFSQRKLKDERDGKKYKTVKIGDQVWMAENLAFKTENGSWIYNNDSSLLAKNGYLYNWETSQSVCPVNWHLPNKAEFDTLISFLGGDEIAGSKMKTNYINDSIYLNYEKVHNCSHDHKKHDSVKVNSSKFNSYFGGAIYYENQFDYLNEYACYWTSTSINDGFAIYLFLLAQKSNLLFEKTLKINGMSVRCIKD